MTKEQIIKVRDMFHKAGVKVQIYGDNSLVPDEALDVVVWDDENELVYALTRSKTSGPIEYPDPNKQVYYTVLGYDVIQYIQASSTYDQFKGSIIDNIPINNEERKTNILQFFYDTIDKRILNKPGSRTVEQIKEESPELYEKFWKKDK